jgi:cell wall assembly regulator SMI1
LDEWEPGLGATVDEIAACEAELRVRLPQDYRQFLQEFGWGAFRHLELYGLGKDVPRFLDVTAETKRERTEFEPYLPDHLVPVMNDGCGNLVCLNTQDMNAATCPVVFWDHDLPDDQEPSNVAGSFAEWLWEEIDAVVEDQSS